TVYYQMSDHHGPQAGVDDINLDVLDPAPVLDQHGIQFICHSHQIILMEEDSLAGGEGIIDSRGLDLGAHHRSGAGSEKASPSTGHAGAIARGGYHRGLLSGHRYEDLLAID